MDFTKCVSLSKDYLRLSALVCKEEIMTTEILVVSQVRTSLSVSFCLMFLKRTDTFYSVCDVRGFLWKQRTAVFAVFFLFSLLSRDQKITSFVIEKNELCYLVITIKLTRYYEKTKYVFLLLLTRVQMAHRADCDGLGEVRESISSKYLVY